MVYGKSLRVFHQPELKQKLRELALCYPAESAFHLLCAFARGDPILTQEIYVLAGAGCGCCSGPASPCPTLGSGLGCASRVYQVLERVPDMSGGSLQALL